jgi:uncharacterized membrane protein YeaQ/YmgE (transglycosylase-associated protein family)
VTRLYLKKFAAFYGGCLACYLLQRNAHLSAVAASALAGLLGTLIPSPGIQGAIYAGSFAGMCSQEILGGHLQVFFLSAVGAAVYLWAKPRFTGFGGKLGAVAFVSSLCLLAVLFLARAFA